MRQTFVYHVDDMRYVVESDDLALHPSCSVLICLGLSE